jgi:hypothetical protein
MSVFRFKGEYLVGQIDSENGAATEALTVEVNYLNLLTGLPGDQTNVFTVDVPDIGRIGFDEEEGSDPIEITSVSFSLTPGAAAWNNVTDIVFAVPELSTWGMMALGFIGLGYAAYRRAGGRNTSPLV